MGLLKTIFLILIFYYSFRFIARIFVPLLIRYFFRKAQKNMKQHSRTPFEKKKEGEVTIEKTKNKSSSSSKSNVGDYVDFEEIEK